MGHLSQDELAALVQEASTKVEIGATYAHYKHPDDDFYVVKGIALIEANDEPAVIYEAQYGAKITFIRPVSVWCEAVEWNGEQVPRFVKVRT
jgi:hypothetical protein